MSVARGPHARTGLAIAGLGLAVACRSTGELPAARRLPAAEPPPTAQQATAIEQIVYELRGGVAGFDLELRVESGGSASVHDARGRVVRRGQLEPRSWQELVRLVDAARLPELKARYGMSGAVADAMHEVVSVRSGTGTLRVSVESDPADEPPEAFSALAVRLRELALTLPAI